jgi:hypothetical protein
MNNDYLFEKKGSDAEIELLEAAMSVYRVDPVAPSLSRAAIVEKAGPAFGRFRSLFPHAFAFGLFAVLALIAISAVWLGRGTTNEITAVSPAEIIAPATTSVPLIARDQPPAHAVKKPTTVEVKPKQFVPIATNKKPQLAKFIQRKSTAKPRLTQEEQYAYDQLKVALWLAGSKLKVVQDTIDRTGDKDSSTDKR